MKKNLINYDETVNIQGMVTFSVFRGLKAKKKRTCFNMSFKNLSVQNLVDLLQVYPNDCISWINTVSGDVVFLSVYLGGNTITFHLNETEIPSFSDVYDKNKDIEKRVSKTNMTNG